MVEAKETKSRECSWCMPKEDETEKALYLGAGAFRDIDSDFSDGIPVCGGCGGLGHVVENEEFLERVRKIQVLRRKYCPVVKEIPIEERLRILGELIEEIRKLYADYIIVAQKGCYAERIANGCLDGITRELSGRTMLHKQANGGRN